MDRFTFDVTDDEAARGLREQAAAHGRSVEAELDALVRETYARAPAAAAPQAQDDDWVHELIRIANGAGEGVFEDEREPLREFDLDLGRDRAPHGDTGSA